MVKKWTKVSPRVSIHIRVLYSMGYTVTKIHKEKYPDIPRTTIDYHAKKPVESEEGDRRKNNRGRLRKLTDGDLRLLKRKVVQLRDFNDVNFSAVKLQKLCGLEHLNVKTIHRALRNNNLQYLNTRQKGILAANDRKQRVEYCKKIISVVGEKQDELWSKSISFYYDGVNFYHKKNPYSDAVATRVKIWRKRGEGLRLSRKGKKEGNGGKKLRLFVAISYGKGVIMCEEFPREQRYYGVNYKNFVIEHFPEAFRKCCNDQKLVLQDGDPVQTSKQAQLAYDQLKCSMFKIPPRSPDLNPIENIFHNVRRKLSRDVIERKIEKETFDEYATRVIETIRRTSVDLIDRTIASQRRRVESVIKSKGDRIKY